MILSNRFNLKNKKQVVRYYIKDFFLFFKFLQKISKNKNFEIYIYFNKLNYSEKYLKLKKKIYYCTILIVKSNKSLVKVFSKETKIKNKIFKILK